MKRTIFIAALICLVMSTCNCMASEDPSAVFGSVNWLRGPATASLGTHADINMSKGYMFANGDDTRRLLEAMKNIPSGAELGLVGTEDLGYFAVYSFDETGYVKDEEKDKLDADAILNQLKKGTEKSNEERQKRGWPAMNVVGWAIQPNYNPETHNLEWAVKFADSKGQESVNFSTRYLGRRGVMRVTLVSDPSEFQSVLPKFRNLMNGFTYKQGNKYTEYIQGDKVAKYGLSALIVGGAAAAAVKSGFGKYLFKIVMGFGLAVVAFAKTAFEKIAGLFRRKPRTND